MQYFKTPTKTTPTAIHFKYQSFWLRVISVIPVIFLLAYIEYMIFDFLIEDSEKYSFYFYIFSALLTIAFAKIGFKYTAKIFTKNGEAELSEDMLTIKLKSKEITVGLDDNSTVELHRINVYGAALGMLTVAYCEGKIIKLYSEDCDSLESCGLFGLYEALKERSK